MSGARFSVRRHLTSPAVRRPALALVGGFLLFAGHPPVGLGWLGLVALVPLVALGRDLAAGPRRRGAAAGWGFLAGLILFLPLVPWLIPFGYVAWLGLSVVQALFVAFYVAVLSAWGERRGRAAVAVLAWVALEALRGSRPLGGFGWGALSVTQADGGLVLGVARTLGAAGITLVLATVAVAIEEAVRVAWTSIAAARDTEIPADTVFRAIQPALLTVLGVLTVAVLLSGEAPAPTDRTTSFGIVQAGDTRGTSAAGVNRQDTGRIVRVAELMLEATRPFADDPPDVVVWPENALDADVRTPDGATVADLLDQALDLVAPSPILGGDIEEGPRPGTRYNNLTVFTTDGIGPSYTKRQPVPFAEYVPARAALDWFPPLQQIPSDVLQGTGPQVLSVGGAEVGGVICFENGFGRLVRDQVLAGADVLVVATNNSSFGVSAMSAQHIALSQVRAVETGRWVVHAGISGISGFVSPDGVISQRTDLFEPASPRMDVPLIDGLTPAMRLGDAVPLTAQVLLVVALVVLLVARLRAPRQDDGTP